MINQSLNGCHNREESFNNVMVQDGWVESFNSDLQIHTRIPLMKVIKDPMTKGCSYQKRTKNDEKCKGCRWIE